jgi:hypothetical protein
VAAGVVLAVGLGCAGHSVAGGQVSVSGAVFAAALLAGPLWLAGRRELTAPMIALLLTFGQLLVHVAFLGSHDPAAHADSTPWVMWLAHTAAGALLGLWLRVGERKLWQAAKRRVAMLVRPRLPRAVAVLVRVARQTPHAATSAPLRHSIVLRGPPAGV